ncbi:glutaredoxin family protein [Haliea sp. E1-2-M8]|nr:glutaredoxin family protein [Haliea sp. E1-2-M8]MDO8862416.1 glutaredoxin family protein [Haliea sp. E1-2-M8]
MLYGTSACHLCEQAESLLQQATREGLAGDFIKVDISDSDDLFARYGLRIPVLKRRDGAELGWPFGAAELAAFLTEPQRQA